MQVAFDPSAPRLLAMFGRRRRAGVARARKSQDMEPYHC